MTRKISIHLGNYRALNERAGFRPGSRGPFVSAKEPKTIDAPFGLIGRDKRGIRRAVQLTALKQGPLNTKSVRPKGQTAGVGLKQGSHTYSKALGFFGNALLKRAWLLGVMQFLGICEESGGSARLLTASASLGLWK